VASDTGTLLSATHPEESGFALHCFVCGIQEFNLKRLLGGDLNEE
jgi:hypothetical protein